VNIEEILIQVMVTLMVGMLTELVVTAAAAAQLNDDKILWQLVHLM